MPVSSQWLLQTVRIGLSAFVVVMIAGCPSSQTKAEGDAGQSDADVDADGSMPEAGCLAPDGTPGCCTDADCCGGMEYIDGCGFACVHGECSETSCQTADGCPCGTAVSECLPPGCNSDGECDGGQCVGGLCATRVGPASVASCAVQPANAVTHQGDDKTFTVLSFNSAGAVIPYIPVAGELTWSVTGDVSLASSPTAASATVTGGSGSGTATVAVSMGSSSDAVGCMPATVQNVAAIAAPNTLQVTVAGEHGNPVADAIVVASDASGDTDTGVTSTGGTWVSQTVFDATVDVSVFATGFSYVSVLGTSDSDLVVFLKQLVPPGILGNNMEAPAFSSLQNIQGTVHLAINGPSLAGNLMDVSLSTLLGPGVPTTINLGGMGTMVNLPEGILLGLGDQMFKDGYAVQSDPGLHTAWGLAGNVVLSDVLGVISGAVDGGSVDVGSILMALLPVIGDLQSAVTAGQTFESGVGGEACTVNSDCSAAASACVNGSSIAGECVVPVTLNFDTLLRINVTVMVPVMPQYTVGTTPTQLTDALILAGALYEPQGFVPLGLTAGADQNTGTTMNGVPDGITDPVTIGSTTYPPGELPISFASRHDGIEGAPQTFVALATNASDLFGGGPLALSGLVSMPSAPLTYAGGQGATVANTVSFTNTAGVISAFMGLPTNPTFTTVSRTLAFAEIAPPGPTPDLHELDITATDASGNPIEWRVYFAPPTTGASVSATVPATPAGFADPVGSGGTFTLKSASLKLQSGYDFDSVFTFGGDTTDNLTADTDAFSVIGVSQ